MDGFLNKAKGALSQMGNKSQGSAQQGSVQQGGDPNVQQTGNAGSSGQMDYGDKALDFIEKKTGHTFSRDQNEKITDGARNFYEKQTGKKVDSKYSN